MYYVVTVSYVGPNQDEASHIDADVIEIRTSPARTNSSREKRIEGWCGTTNDWDVYAHGKYTSIQKARSAIYEKFGDVREIDLSDDIRGHEGKEGGAVVETYKRGKYQPMSYDETAEWAYESIRSDIRADTTDDRISELAELYREDANIEGYELHSRLEDLMYEHRSEMSEE